MKYKAIFKAWWFYVVIILYSILAIIREGELRDLLLIEYPSIFIGSFMGALFMFTFFWLIINFFKWIHKMITKR